MSQTPNCAIAVIGIDIGKNWFHVVGHDARCHRAAAKVVAGPSGSSAGQYAALLSFTEACVGAHSLSGKLGSLR